MAQTFSRVAQLFPGLAQTFSGLAQLFSGLAQTFSRWPQTISCQEIYNTSREKSNGLWENLSGHREKVTAACPETSAV